MEKDLEFIWQRWSIEAKTFKWQYFRNKGNSKRICGK